MSGDSRDFDWIDAADDVVVPEQPAVACYVNPHGALVLRQRADPYFQDCDPWIVVERSKVAALVTAMIRTGELPFELASTGAEAGLPAKPPHKGAKDSTAAARQKRRRQRLRDAVTAEGVTRDTDCDADCDADCGAPLFKAPVE